MSDGVGSSVYIYISVIYLWKYQYPVMISGHLATFRRIYHKNSSYFGLKVFEWEDSWQLFAMDGKEWEFDRLFLNLDRSLFSQVADETRIESRYR